MAIIQWRNVATPATQFEPGRVLLIPSLTLSDAEVRKLDEEWQQQDVSIRAPVLLDFPVLVAQLPYILLRHPAREWVPAGMLAEDWRALSWPVVGLSSGGWRGEG